MIIDHTFPDWITSIFNVLSLFIGLGTLLLLRVFFEKIKGYQLIKGSFFDIAILLVVVSLSNIVYLRSPLTLLAIIIGGTIIRERLFYNKNTLKYTILEASFWLTTGIVGVAFSYFEDFILKTYFI